jgi:hypothetical protein
MLMVAQEFQAAVEVLLLRLMETPFCFLGVQDSLVAVAVE